VIGQLFVAALACWGAVSISFMIRYHWVEFRAGVREGWCERHGGHVLRTERLTVRRCKCGFEEEESRKPLDDGSGP